MTIVTLFWNALQNFVAEIEIIQSSGKTENILWYSIVGKQNNTCECYKVQITSILFPLIKNGIEEDFAEISKIKRDWVLLIFFFMQEHSGSGNNTPVQKPFCGDSWQTPSFLVSVPVIHLEHMLEDETDTVWTAQKTSSL